MRFFATIDDHTYEVVIDNERITVDGTPVEADMQRAGLQGLYSLLLDHLSHEVEVEADAFQRGQYGVLVAGVRYEVKVQDERVRRLSAAERKSHGPAGEVAIRAPIPGLVVKVLVEPGQQVVEGEALLILEAMKMENELRAPRDGVIHEVRATTGGQVALGQVLVSIRATED